MTTEHNTPEPVVIRYYTPGIGYRAKTFKTQAAFDRWLDTIDDDVIVEVRD